MKTKILIAAIAVFSLSGCADDVSLLNPRTFQTVTCEGGCLYLSDRQQFRCIDDFQRQGYQRVAFTRRELEKFKRHQASPAGDDISDILAGLEYHENPHTPSSAGPFPPRLRADHP
jgi:hypothetical protein